MLADGGSGRGDGARPTRGDDGPRGGDGRSRSGGDRPPRGGGASRDALDGIRRLVVDGTNVLHALRRSPQPLPAAALIGRLRATVPPEVTIVLVLDGSPEYGLKTSHLASGVLVRYAGREPADTLIGHLVEEHRGDAATLAAILVVTDDIDLSWTVRRLGARTVPARWLVSRLARQHLVAPAPALPRAPRPSGSEAAATESGDGDDERRWSPGRGATRKRGNARRPPKRGGGGPGPHL